MAATVTLALVAGGYIFKPKAPAQQMVPQTRAVQTISVMSFRQRWDALGQLAAPPPPIAPQLETYAAWSGPPVPEDIPQQIEAPPPLRRELRERAAPRPVMRELCARHGLRRVEYRRGGHLYWRCAPHQGA